MTTMTHIHPSASRPRRAAQSPAPIRPANAVALPEGSATRFALLDSPVGRLLLAADADGRLTRLHFPDDPRAQTESAGWTRDDEALAEPCRQLQAYFAGELRDFDLELAPSGTPFQLRVWEALREIPYGATASYGEIAQAAGMPGAARAVGGANNRNPIAIVVPCHRVIGASGSLTGYGGGLDRKRRLLDLEAGRPTLAA